MIKKIKKWFYDHFLPMWAKETVLMENKRLQQEVNNLRREIAIKDSYIDGLMVAIKSRHRIIINTAEERK